MSLQKTHEMNTLLSFYKSLLTKKQQTYMSLYYEKDLTLGEIAASSDVSRQAVYDAIRRAEKALLAYEEQLHVAKDFLHNIEVIENTIAYVEKKYPEDQELLSILKGFTIRE